MLCVDYITEQGKIDSKKKKDLLYARYSDAKPQARGAKAQEFVTDLEQWDSEQINKAQLTSGALDREVIEDSYDFVFDESVKIQFALDAEDRIEGTLSGKDAALQAQIDEAERRGELIRCFCRRSISDSICSQRNQSTRSGSLYRSTNGEKPSSTPSRSTKSSSSKEKRDQEKRLNFPNISTKPVGRRKDSKLDVRNPVE